MGSAFAEWDRMAKEAKDKAEAPARALQNMHDQQVQYANQFRSNLPNLQRQMASQLADQSFGQMNSALKQNKQSNSNRGMLYGGVNQGQQSQIRGAAQAGLAKGISTENASLEGAANTLQAQAVQSGLGIQANQQAIQNQAYQEAMAANNSQNQMIGQMASTAALAAILL